MDDTGEKIIFLARELLNAGVPEIPQEKKQVGITMSFKMLCLTTFLAAAGSGAATAWIHEQSRPLDRYEKTEIQALLYYASKLKGVNEDNLRRDVEKQINIASFDDMTIGEFPLVRHYLQEKAQ